MLEQIKEFGEVILTWVKENPKTTAAIVAMPVGVYAGKKISEELLAKAFEEELKKQLKEANKRKNKKNKKKKEEKKDEE